MIHLIDKFTEHLRKGKYNQVTIKAYRDAIFLFYNAHRDVPTSKLNDELVAKYLQDLKEKRNYSSDAVIQAGKAIKLYFKIIFQKNLLIKATGEQKEKLPDILTKEEIKRIIEHISNRKHKAIITFIYAFGLKLNEILELKKSDVDLENMLLEVGKKKHYSYRKLRIPLSVLDEFKYLIEHSKSDEFLISGNARSKFSPRGVQLFFTKAVEELGIEKEVTIQSLRHSYAVHLLQKGLDIHHLQTLLGHKYLQTTSMYLDYIDFKTEHVVSPIDDIL